MAQPEPSVRVELEWEEAKRFRGGPPGGPTLVLDGDGEAAPGPVQAVALAIAGCSAIDVLEILRKRRTPASSLRVSVEYTRAPTPPRKLTAVKLRFVVATASERSHVERAVALSLESYCSVSSSLDPAIPITTEVELLTGTEPGP